MSQQERLDSLAWFMTHREQDVFDRFSQITENHVFYKAEEFDFSFLYIPGHREDRVLLVAHADTVWHDSDKLSLGFDEKYGVFYSKNRQKGFGKKLGQPFLRGLGIGADDRAGCAALMEMKDLGHSILIVNGEEHGSMGSIFAMSDKDFAEELQNHNFVVQYDRNGRDDLVFYNVGTRKFVNYCQKNMKGFTETNSMSSTDICHICEKICGVNISIGYKKEHTPNEFLSYRYWENTVDKSLEWLAKPTNKFLL